MDTRVSIAKNGALLGSFTIIEAKNAIDLGIITDEDYFLDEKTNEWRRINEHLEFKAILLRIKDKRRKKKIISVAAGSAAVLLFAAICFVLGLKNATQETTLSERIGRVDDKAAAGHQTTNDSKNSTAANLADAPITKVDGSRIALEKVESNGTRPLEITPIGRYGKELFPSFILSLAGLDLKNQDGTSHKYGEEAHAAFIVRNIKKGDILTLELSSDRFINPVKTTFAFDEDKKHVMLAPKTTFDYISLARNRQTVPFNVTFRASRNDGAEFSHSQVWHMRQVNDCPLLLSEKYLGDDGVVAERLSPLTELAFAGYVNENHPWIDAILADALKTGLVDSFAGMQSNNNAQIENELTAIWQALKMRGVTYSSITDTSGQNSQHVRFFEECIGTAQANCIDGTVMLASIYRKIGFPVGVALVPNHAYLVFFAPDGSLAFGIETTSIGTRSLNAAMMEAVEGARFSVQKINAMSVEERIRNKIHVINIDYWRKKGVEPIPYLGKDGLIDSAPPKTQATARAMVNEDLIQTDSEVYLNSNGVLSARQFGARVEQMARIIIEKNAGYDKTGQQKRKAIAYKLYDEIEAAAFALSRGNITSPGVRAAFTRCIEEAERHRKEFNAMPRKPSLLLSGNRVADAEMTEIYSTCLKNLSSTELKPATSYSKEDINAAMSVCTSLRTISDLPLIY
jgi:hypothetical protein